LKNKNGEFEKFRTNYLDERNEPLFPFGYGLSYTTFTYSNLEISKPKMTAGEKLKVTLKVKNAGNYDGKEVVQLYIRDVVGSVSRPMKELKGFQKIFIKKGEEKLVMFEIGIDDLKFYNSDLQFVSEPGNFEVFVGTNSDVSDKIGFELVD
jgi:beta-glucosidase